MVVKKEVLLRISRFRHLTMYTISFGFVNSIRVNIEITLLQIKKYEVARNRTKA